MVTLMRIPRKVNLFLSFCLIFSVVIGNISISLPVFAAEKTSANFEQSRTGVRSNSSGPSFGRQNAAPKEMEEKSGLAKSQQAETKRKDYVEGEILVKYKSDKINLDTFSGRASALNFANSRSLERKEDLRKNNISVLRIKDSRTVEDKITELKSDPNVEYVEPNYRRYPAIINTDDTNKGLLWGLDNTGQTVGGTYATNNPGSVDKDIDASEAWVISETATSTPVIVAIIDTGVAYNHPDLATNMWDGTNCKDEKGVAIVGGCNHGYDYENNDNTPLPATSSHGTHIAGTIAASKNNGKGVIGVAPQTKIMAIKFGLDITSEIKAIDFAIQNGAKIINASFGGDTFSQFEYDEINRFKTAGGIFVAAAGNETANNESTHSYPSDYNLDNIISVAATDQNDALADFSNYGSTSVDVGAPGVNIFSTIADSVVLFETFESITPPAVPNSWVTSGTNDNWGTYDLDGGTFWGNVLYGDWINLPYTQTADTTIISEIYDLSAGGATGATIDFWARCDTEYITDGWADYMQLEYSADGASFSPAVDPYFGGEFRWDEPTFDILNGEDPLDSAGASLFHYKDILIPDQYLTSNFKFQFRWVANGNSDTGGGDGCLVDDIKITKFSDGSDEQYDYMQGTSMAAPHVAGLAGLVWGYKPSLTSAEVKSTILETGDDVLSHAGKTVTGKRINAFNALNSLVSETHTISGIIKYYDGVKTVPGAMVILEDGLGAHIATTTTDIGGSYQFTDVVSGGDYVVRVNKDDTASGLSGADQGKIGRHIVGLELFDSIYKTISGDVNNSGGLSGADQGKIGRFIVGLDSDLFSGAWKFYSSEAVLNITNYLITGLTRIYTNLTDDTLNQDFIGVKMGDVNNSWNQ